MKTPILDVATIHFDLSEAALYEWSLKTEESKIAHGGALVADTGEHTGRSPKDKFTVQDELTEHSVDWSLNKAISPAQFDLLYEDFINHAKGKTLYGQNLLAGADVDSELKVTVITQLAWHSLFIRNMLRRPDRDSLPDFQSDLTVIDLPTFKANPERHGVRSETVIACDFSRKIILIGGTQYAGEMKKSVFSYLNFILPTMDIMPMHCSANTDEKDGTAVFFGLSGTGKTTLSADPSRTLIGDDEHGWSANGIFNFEGGCYAKTIRLSQEAEPEIYSTTQRFGTILENIVMDDVTHIVDFDDGRKTENTRCAYPIEFIPNASKTGKAGHPKNIIMLTCDAFGVMPPLAKLTPEQAVVHFLSGYTAKVAGTEQGVTEPEATFSTCFGAPFMPRRASEYGALLMSYIEKYNVQCWLVNTGWSGGAYGVGERMPLKTTRNLLSAALSGALHDVQMRVDAVFGFEVPVAVAQVDEHILNPRNTWNDKPAYDTQANKLLKMFQENFTKYRDGLSEEIVAKSGLF